MPNEARAKTGYGMPYLVPAWLISEHRDQDEDVGEEDREQRLVPGHPEGDQAGGQQPGRDVDRHADPQGEVVVGGPGPLRDRDRGQVLVVERRTSRGRRRPPGSAPPVRREGPSAPSDAIAMGLLPPGVMGCPARCLAPLDRPRDPTDAGRRTVPGRRASGRPDGSRGERVERGGQPTRERVRASPAHRPGVIECLAGGTRAPSRARTFWASRLDGPSDSRRPSTDRGPEIARRPVVADPAPIDWRLRARGDQASTAPGRSPRRRPPRSRRGSPASSGRRISEWATIRPRCGPRKSSSDVQPRSALRSRNVGQPGRSGRGSRSARWRGRASPPWRPGPCRSRAGSS